MKAATTLPHAEAIERLEKPSARDAVRGLGVIYGPSLALEGWWLAGAVSTAVGYVRGAGGPRKLLRLSLAVGAFAPWAYFAFLRPRILFWGARSEEAKRYLPGDDIVPNPLASNTRAVTIAAPPEEVWPWLVQIGYGRGGWYSYDALERAAGAAEFLEGHSALETHTELQELRPGDVIKMSRWTGFEVASADPGRALVLYSPGDGSRLMAESTWAFVLEPAAAGSTRLLVRGRSTSDPRRPLPALLDHLLEIPHFVMERKMLLGLKERAEASERASRTPTLLDEIIPNLEFADEVAVQVSAPAQRVFDALGDVTAADMPLATLLGRLRYLPQKLRGRDSAQSQAPEPFIQALLRKGTVMLAQEPAREIVFGGAGKYHQVVDQEPVRFQSAEEFHGFAEPDYQKLVISFRLEPGGAATENRLVLAHRTLPLSADSRRHFARYWRVIKPSGAFVSRQLLLAIKRRAESTP